MIRLLKITNLQQVRGLYKKIGLVNLLLSGLGFFILYSYPLGERISILLVTNIGYHMMYHSITRGTKWQLNHIRDNKTVFSMGVQGLYFFSYVLIFGGCFATILILFSAIIDKDIASLFSFLIPMGIVLAGLFLKIMIQFEKEEFRGK